MASCSGSSATSRTYARALNLTTSPVRRAESTITAPFCGVQSALLASTAPAASTPASCTCSGSAPPCRCSRSSCASGFQLRDCWRPSTGRYSLLAQGICLLQYVASKIR
ncbi:hypothetical protein VTN96DRAFT_2150 [Rasamsonia emersonii]